MIAENPSEEAPPESSAEVAAGLVEGERILYEVRAAVRRLGANKEWQDLGVGLFSVVGGGAGGARAAFAPPNAVRPLLRAALAPSVTSAAAAPKAASGNPGGVLLTALVEDQGQWKLTRVLVKTKTDAAQADTLAAILSVAGKK